MTIQNNLKMPQMTPEQVAIMENMTPEQQQLMIRMVQQMAGLAAVQASESVKKELNMPEIRKAVEEPTKNLYKILECDFSDIKTKEDFFNERIYTIIFNEKVKESSRKTIVTALKNKARELGGCRFADDVEKICRAKEKEQQNTIKEKQNEARISSFDESGFRTTFTNLPDFSTGNKICGYRFKADDGGIFEVMDKKGKSCAKHICRSSILINRETVLDCGNNESCSTKVELIYRKPGKRQWSRYIMPLKTLTNSKQIDEIRDLGISFSREDADALADYFKDMFELSLEAKEMKSVESTRTYGLNKGKTRFYPYAEDIILENANEWENLIETMRPKGDYDEWIKEMKRLRGQKVTMLNFSIAAALASPIIGLCNRKGFVCNIYGLSGTGKSVSNSISATIFGDGWRDDGYIKSLRNTNTNVEARLGFLKNLPAYFDDLNNTDDKFKEKFKDFVMMIANGQGKGRSNKEITTRKESTWALTLIMNSEYDATRDFSSSGAFNRVLQVSAPKKCPWTKKEVGKMDTFFSENYGLGGAEWIKIILELGQDKISKIILKFDEELEKKSDNTKTGRHISCGAILMAADYIAAKYLFKDGITFTAEEVLSFMVDEQVVDQNKRFYDYLVGFFNENQENFEGSEVARRRNGVAKFWGISLTEGSSVADKVSYMCFTDKIIEEQMKLKEVDKKLFYNYLRENGLLVACKGKNYRRLTSKTLGKSTTVICIRLPNEYSKEAMIEELENMPTKKKEQNSNNIIEAETGKNRWEKNDYTVHQKLADESGYDNPFARANKDARTVEELEKNMDEQEFMSFDEKDADVFGENFTK